MIQWVADHRRHHAFSDVEGDPHSPWRFGDSFWGLTKGLFFAHVGWMFYRELSNRERFAPDLLADKDIRRVDKLFPLLVTLSLRDAGHRRRPAHLVVAGRADRVLLGRPGAHRRCCTT